MRWTASNALHHCCGGGGGCCCGGGCGGGGGNVCDGDGGSGWVGLGVVLVMVVGVLLFGGWRGGVSGDGGGCVYSFL